ncbi:MAG: DUF2784 domain-containing protein [Gammaproteobacteria bacterium]|nr:DUF2784 domain-containing protein [Gammaproteobacteria bacterium]
MGYALLADLVLLLHAAFIGFVLLGGLLVLRWRPLMWLHVPAVIWGILIEVQGWLCPLTPMENRLRKAAGAQGYDAGFIEHYLAPLIYPAGLTPAIQLVLAALVFLINVMIYALLWRVWRKRSA